MIFFCENLYAVQQRVNKTAKANTSVHPGKNIEKEVLRLSATGYWLLVTYSIRRYRYIIIIGICKRNIRRAESPSGPPI